MVPTVGRREREEVDKAIQRLVPRELAERLLATHGQVGRDCRTVTILFSDVKGSTAMAEDLDPEDVMEILDGVFDVLIEPVYRYEGTLARLMGDAILAFFGAPIAHEDDPERGRQLLAEAGYPGGREFPNMEWLVPGQFLGPCLQAKWHENLGVEIPWQMLPWPQLIDRIDEARPHLFMMGWYPDYPDPDSYLRVAVEANTAWRHEPYLALVERARRVMDQERRMALYAQAEKILAAEVPLLPLQCGRLHLLVKPWLQGFSKPAAGPALRNDVVIEPH
jgi:class 3 adenylate cyclase